ncbi:type I methionyl aminopeptidase [Candidatus Wolfebacteria bacterium RIFCSPHIGHO2_01_FULL_48_22]|uniref:Methionine aminopeptidase n=2 Tax=Candidatus Wolfeibacteriota TaxID=1752735 RepID=A0A1F8DQL9_9BACT|nr:MAG: type I methionyl aminopeptidase [Candidatus Wolfebacteria bacterium RIFCSPHIGHO2_01_FULL_48_22]OGM91972.1 MAG: type I methionyl aminopeptidase [Candidatus Wolfebacteria bacterium RIFCSPLOWO2_01_FULL_47_17b]
MILLKKSSEIEYLAQSGKILAAILRNLARMAKKDVPLSALNEQAIKLCKEHGARPAFLGYQPEGAKRAFPAAICASLNETVVHGIPSNRLLQEGDVLKIDMGISYEGFITDSALSVGIGRISPKARALLSATKEALDKAIAATKKGKYIGDIGYEIERTAKKHGMHVLKELTGHGVGYELHEDPVIFNFGTKGTGSKIKEGMVLAIEPMFSISTERVVQKGDESYTSADGSLAAHFEHTVAILANSTVVLTA